MVTATMGRTEHSCDSCDWCNGRTKEEAIIKIPARPAARDQDGEYRIFISKFRVTSSSNTKLVTRNSKRYQLIPKSPPMRRQALWMWLATLPAESACSLMNSTTKVGP